MSIPKDTKKLAGQNVEFLYSQHSNFSVIFGYVGDLPQLERAEKIFILDDNHAIMQTPAILNTVNSLVGTRDTNEIPYIKFADTKEKFDKLASEYFVGKNEKKVIYVIGSDTIIVKQYEYKDINRMLSDIIGAYILSYIVIKQTFAGLNSALIVGVISYLQWAYSEQILGYKPKKLPMLQHWRALLDYGIQHKGKAADANRMQTVSLNMLLIRGIPKTNNAINLFIGGFGRKTLEKEFKLKDRPLTLAIQKLITEDSNTNGDKFLRLINKLK